MIQFSKVLKLIMALAIILICSNAAAFYEFETNAIIDVTGEIYTEEDWPRPIALVNSYQRFDYRVSPTEEIRYQQKRMWIIMLWEMRWEIQNQQMLA